MKKFILLTIFSFFYYSSIYSAFFNSSQNGDWDQPSTWGGIGIPTATDDVAINGHSVTVNGDYSCNNLVINGSLIFDITNRTLIVYGDLSGSGNIDLSNADHSLVLKGMNNSISTLTTNIMTNSSVIYAGTNQIIFPSANYVNLYCAGNGTKTMADDQTIKRLVLNPLSSLTIISGKTITVTDSFCIRSDKTGTGSFINNGTITFPNGKTERHLHGDGTYYNYHFISSPVKNEPYTTFKDFLYWYDAEDSSYYLELGWTLKNTGKLVPGWGYMARIKNDTTVNFYFPSTDFNSTSFTIPIFYTDKDVTQAYEGWNLIGNPYTSALDWDILKTFNPDVENEIHYWNSYKYASYVNGASINVGTGGDGRYIPENQGIFIKAKPTASDFTFNSSACVHKHGTNQDGFWKKEDNAQIIRLQIKTTNKIETDETLIRYKQNALDQYDEFDANKLLLNSASFSQIYTFTKENLSTTPLSINTLPISANTDTINIGLKMAGKTNTAITMTENSLYSGFQPILYDKINSISYTLKLNEPVFPNFSKSYGDITNQFQLLVKSDYLEIPKTISEKPYKTVFNNSSVIISNMNSSQTSIKIIDISGRILKEAKSSENNIILSINDISNGIYVLSIENNQQNFSEKFIKY